MTNMNDTTLHINKACFLMAAWGIAILAGGIISQWFNLSIDFLLLLWAGLSVLGILGQLAGMVRGLGPNLSVWLAVIVVGWVFTYYVTKFDNGAHADLYGDLAGIWLILLGLGYVATAFQVDKRFLIIAALHILAGALIELSARRVVTIDFVDSYSSLIFGLVGGLPLIIAALPMWYPAPAAQEQRQLIHS